MDDGPGGFTPGSRFRDAQRVTLRLLGKSIHADAPWRRVGGDGARGTAAHRLATDSRKQALPHSIGIGAIAHRDRRPRGLRIWPTSLPLTWKRQLTASSKTYAIESYRESESIRVHPLGEAATGCIERPICRLAALQLLAIVPLLLVVVPCQATNMTHAAPRPTAVSRFNGLISKVLLEPPAAKRRCRSMPLCASPLRNAQDAIEDKAPASTR